MSVPPAIAMLAASLALAARPIPAVADEPEFTQDFRLEDCQFQSSGANPYFVLQPGHQLTLEGEDEGLALRVVITVLDETRGIVVPGIGLVTTRVVEEREWENEELIERSLNFFAVCAPTNDVYYFGETVDIFEPDGSVSHEGAWLAGKGGAAPGIIMPGTFLLGSRYYQELAAGIALDRAEHVESGLAAKTDAGNFKDCVRIIETSPLEPGSESEKVYCPGIGLVVDNEVTLTDFEAAD
jgi:hypothetical protein